jgi:hypothetical protein
VCVGLGRIVPGVAHVSNWPYQVVGAGYGVLGLGFMAGGHLRARAVERAVDRGEFARLDQRIGLAVLGAGLVLGIATIVLVVVTA